MSSLPIISLQQVSKSFGKSGAASSYIAVDRLDLQIGRGQMLALLGKVGDSTVVAEEDDVDAGEPQLGVYTVHGGDSWDAGLVSTRHCRESPLNCPARRPATVGSRKSRLCPAECPRCSPECPRTLRKSPIKMK